MRFGSGTGYNITIDQFNSFGNGTTYANTTSALATGAAGERQAYQKPALPPDETRPAQSPFRISRGDGRAALGPVLREYVVAEAMQALDYRPNPAARRLASYGPQIAAHRDRVLAPNPLTQWRGGGSAGGVP